MLDVLIVGAGPAGSVAATILARAGARVRLVDRARFPRDKLCGDTVNPGTLALLRRLGLSGSVERHGRAVEGMRLTGGNGVTIDSRYPDGLLGRAIVRRDVDWSLLLSAIAAGAQFESPVAVRRVVMEGERGASRVTGALVSGGNGAVHKVCARVTIAADGRRSTVAFGLRLAAHPPRPRRWAIGAYFGDVAGLSTFGEMHVRAGRYIGVAAVPGGVTNVCLVRPLRPGAKLWTGGRDPWSVLVGELAADAMLRDRFAGARLAQPPVVLGPLAVDVRPTAIDGLLLAGDAAGFVDPITGDGLRFAVRGGELAAVAALEALEHGWTGVHARLAARRRLEFSGKQRFNRALRVLVASPRGVGAAAFAARFAPGIFRRIIRKAGDCDLC
jgi:flavin-dependent dehydrogenase